jgi:antitoxin component YwqK of YwqJK toxin-antitoxin module
VWKDGDGAVIGELRNTWSGDRLMSVLWKSETDERLIEYEYDSGNNRIAERNYKQGVLERSVVSKDGKETEEIFMNGKLILRVLWENGRKLSEERVFR